MPKTEKKMSQVESNYEYFKTLLPSIASVHRNKYALISNKKVLGYYSSMVDAYTSAKSFLKEGEYSIQQVTTTPVDLGFFSHAVRSG